MAHNFFPCVVLDRAQVVKKDKSMREATRCFVLIALLATGCKTMPWDKSLRRYPDGISSHGNNGGQTEYQPARSAAIGQSSPFGHSHGCQGTSSNCVPHGQRLPTNVLRGNAPATVSYPNYSVRGPREFFLDNPPSIGP